jgi:hypothetical protein
VGIRSIPLRAELGDCSRGLGVASVGVLLIMLTHAVVVV